MPEHAGKSGSPKLLAGGSTRSSPHPSKQEAVRSLDIGEDDEIDAREFSDWVRQAAELPGVKM